MKRVLLAARLGLADLIRRRLTLVLLFVVPALFDAVVLATSAKRDVPVVLAALRPADTERLLDERGLTLVFMGTAAVCFLTCFLAFHLVHKRRAADARLVLAGYRAHELLASKLLVLAVIVLAMSVYETLILRPFLEPRHLPGFVVGLFLAGLVYACVGLFVGAVAGHELEGIFVIVLLTNVDVGWLQNPVYYATSERRGLIEMLPGHSPAQLAIASAFTDETATGAIGRSLAYAGATLVVVLAVFTLRIRPHIRALGGAHP